MVRTGNWGAEGHAAGPGLFVRREAELAQLDSALRDVLSGRGCVRFVVGEAGSGKTALTREFVSRAQERHPELLVVIGQSDAQTGIGDPYLPFREVLALLTGDVDDQLAKGVISEENAGRLRRFLGVSGEALLDLGPDLIGTLIPGAGLATRAATYIARKAGKLEKLEELAEGRTVKELEVGGIEQSHIFEQYTNVITHLAEHRPLVVVLDDLHWADVASMGLLFRLGRNVGESRVLLLGAYRPAEVAIGRNGARHPLEKVLAEFKRYFGNIDVDLGDAGEDERRGLADALVDLEPNRLSDAFRRGLFDHTGGHPLFTVELLRALQERGDLVLDAGGRWVEGRSIHWDTVPARVEGVIEERIGRLDEDAQEALTVASVEGEQFTAEVVAAVQEVDARRLVRRMGRDLEQQHRLVRSQGVRRLGGDGLRLSLFAFRHNLFQRYLYTGLSEADRTYLHEDVGNALEALSADGVDDFVVQLARHFVEAGIGDKARRYLRRAGELSLQRHANDEAADYLARALALTPDGELADRWSILSLLERVHSMQGERSAQTEDLDAMRTVARGLDIEAQTEVAVREAALSYAIGDFPGAVASAQAAIEIAGPLRDVAREARARIEWGYSLLEQGQLDQARDQLEHAYALADGAALHRVQPRSLNGLARINSQRGEFGLARRGYREALRICQRLNDTIGVAKAINSLGILEARSGDFERAGTYFEDALARKRQLGDRNGEGRVLHNLGEVASEQHDLATARSRYSESRHLSAQTGDQSTECASLMGLGGVAVRLGLYGEARDHLKQSLTVSRAVGVPFDEGEILAWLAVLAVFEEDFESARDYSLQAIEIARNLAEPLLEGRALDLLGRSLEGLGRWSEAGVVHEDSLTTRERFGQTSASTEPCAGLARVAQARGDVAGAVRWVERILVHLDTGNLDRTAFPADIYLTCYRVLAEVGDGRASDVLSASEAYLRQIAERIEDPAVRSSFLDNVATHRELLRLSETERR